MSIPMKLRLFFIAATMVVPEPQRGSRTILLGADQDIMWSFASCSGNVAGCWLCIPVIAVGEKDHTFVASFVCLPLS